MSAEEPNLAKTDKDGKLEMPPPPVTTHHTRKIGGAALSWDADFGFLPLQSQSSDVEATLSFTYYRLTESSADGKPRPLTFLFNGGPGSASIWLHMGGLGPRRVRLADDGAMPPPPFEVIDNDFTWLTFSDLVFIDPVDTGYSKAANDELRKKFLSTEGDLDQTGEFIRRFLSRYNRWSSPLFIAGESYGTFRSAGLAGKLAEKGIIFNGVILISSVLELGTLLFESGDDMPFVVYVPTYAAIARHHGVLDAGKMAMPIDEFLQSVREWAASVFAPALAQGALLSQDQRSRIAGDLSAWIGIDQDLIERWDLRVSGERFCNELLKREGRTVGRLDARFTGFDPTKQTDDSEFDPSMSAIRAPFTAAFNSYVRSELGHTSDDDYHVLRNLDWDWGDARAGAPRTNTLLEEAFSRNPYLHVQVLSGYYDLATPFFATEYTLNRLRIDPALRQQIETVEYAGGHMMYIARDILEQLHQDVDAFVQRALAVKQHPLRPR
ncbi:MAG: S10 family peptidase [Thermomicrobiales bacterium]